MATELGNDLGGGCSDRSRRVGAQVVEALKGTPAALGLLRRAEIPDRVNTMGWATCAGGKVANAECKVDITYIKDWLDDVLSCTGHRDDPINDGGTWIQVALEAALELKRAELAAGRTITYDDFAAEYAMALDPLGPLSPIHAINEMVSPPKANAPQPSAPRPAAAGPSTGVVVAGVLASGGLLGFLLWLALRSSPTADLR